ncbi:hypothetical protein ACN47E_007211 [Coniothyrium glycines]
METTASIIAIVDLSAKIIKYINGVVGAKDDKQRLRNQIRNESQAWAETLHVLQPSLMRLREVLDLAAVQLLSKDTIQARLKWPFKEKEIEKLIEAIDCEKSLILLALENNSAKLLNHMTVQLKQNTAILIQLRQLLGDGTQNQQIKLQEIENGISSVRHDQKELITNMSALTMKQETRAALDERDEVSHWLSRFDYASQQSNAFSRRQVDTGQWFLNSDAYTSWLGGSKQTLFCPGIPGAGKSVMTSIVLDNLWQKHQGNNDIGIAFVYLDYSRSQEQTLEVVLATILKQLVSRRPTLSQSIRAFYEWHDKGQRRPSVVDITNALRQEALVFSRVFIVVDALDECSTEDSCRAALLAELFTIRDTCRVNLLATSRWLPEITDHFDKDDILEVQASQADVRKYLDSQIPRLPKFIVRNISLQEEIRSKIVECVDGMFLLARLHLESIMGKTSVKAVRQALEDLATGSSAYDAAYAAAMSRIQGQLPDQEDLAMRVLRWVVHAHRPLHTREIREALGVEVDLDQIDMDNCPDIDTIISACAGLVVVDNESYDKGLASPHARLISSLNNEVKPKDHDQTNDAYVGHVRLVHYTAQEYFERTGTHWFPGAQDAMTSFCLAYITHSTLQAERETMSYADGKPGYEEFKEEHAFWAYSTRHWAFHASLSTTVHSRIMDFLRNRKAVEVASIEVHHPREITWPAKAMLEEWCSALHLAAHFGLAAAVRDLIDEGAKTDAIIALRNCNHLDLKCSTPLAMAARAGHIPVAELLLTKHASLEIDADTGTSPLFWAVFKEHGSLTESLLDHGANPVRIVPSSRYFSNVLQSGIVCSSYLHLAVRNGSLGIARALLRHSTAELIDSENSTRSLLHYAASVGSAEFVELFISAGADIMAVDPRGLLPVHCAAMRSPSRQNSEGKDDVLSTLINAGTPVDSTFARHGKTALHFAVKRESDAAVRTLLAHGASTQAMDNMKATPLRYASEHKGTGIIRQLLDVGADVNARDSSDLTPLLGAIWDSPSVNTVQQFLDAGADPNLVDSNRLSPLMAAVRRGWADVVQMLLSHGSSIDHKDNLGHTALYAAAAMGHAEILEILIHGGATVECKDNNGETALDAALQEMFRLEREVSDFGDLEEFKYFGLDKSMTGWRSLEHPKDPKDVLPRYRASIRLLKTALGLQEDDIVDGASFT